MPECTCSAAVTVSPVYSYDGNRWLAQPRMSCDAVQGRNMALIARALASIVHASFVGLSVCSTFGLKPEACEHTYEQQTESTLGLYIEQKDIGAIALCDHSMNQSFSFFENELSLAAG